MNNSYNNLLNHNHKLFHNNLRLVILLIRKLTFFFHNNKKIVISGYKFSNKHLVQIFKKILLTSQKLKTLVRFLIMFSTAPALKMINV